AWWPVADGGWSTRLRPVDRLIGERVGDGVLGARDVVGRPAPEPAERAPRRGPQRDELGVLDPPATGQLLHDQLRVEQEVDLRRAKLLGELEGPDDARVFGHVVRLDAEVVRDRGIGPGPRIAGVR